ncbi:Nse1 non-SMC component of SMC5-6 complex-domain-containing protein [Endogone sp. FLAS-F59071]|nr:Nse1 non-SMC component of SMC5-6 complex-domain-containing protein [Endogone sp. FLAS-F59071]|eukprot:RUS20981.1 Nse1 non-SMC component of SMC5-6 complex-domain-containing protein [Endogone sp. FLAS-F59071]
MARYTDTHRLFLQALISCRTLKEAEAIEIYLKCCELTGGTYEGTEDGFPNFIATVNDGVSQLDLEVRKMLDEIDGEPSWALVNTNDDEIAQLATEYSAAEITYFKRLTIQESNSLYLVASDLLCPLQIDLIVHADDEAFSVTSLVALREASKLKPSISKSAAETLLDRFVADGWLIKSRTGRYSMSTRCLLELQGYLREEYEEDILECTLCLDILTKGQRCDLQKCSARLHHHCARNYFARNQDEAAVCMTCKTAWQVRNVVGDDGRTGHDNRTSKPQERGISRKKKRVVREEGEDDAMDVERQEVSEEEEPLERRPRRKVEKGKGKARAGIGEEEWES